MAATTNGKHSSPASETSSPVRQPSNSSTSARNSPTSETATPAQPIGNQAMQRFLHEILQQGGEPLDPALRSFYEPKFGQSLDEVRVHRSPQAADVASSLDAKAFTIGNDIVFGSGEYDPATDEGRSLIAHELTHVVQSQQSPANQADASAVSSPDHPAEVEATRNSRQAGPASIVATPGSLIHRNGPEGDVSEPPVENTATFVLDPALADVVIPSQVSTHVRIQEPAVVGDDTQLTDRYVELERPIQSAKRICTFAVPLDKVFDTWADAWANTPGTPFVQPVPPWSFEPTMLMTPVEPRLPPDIGTQVYTISGYFTVASVRNDLVFTDTYTPEAVGAGAVVLLETDAGPVLLDAGLQLNNSEIASDVGNELADLVIAQLGPRDVSEAILVPNPPSGYALPHISDQVRFLSVRATKDQYDQGAVTEVLHAQNEYRKWYEATLRDTLTANRIEWENTQPIAPNNSIREQRWNAHLEAELASAIAGYQPPRLLVAEQTGQAHLQLRDEEFTQGPPSDTGAVPDLSTTQWVPADDQRIFIYGNGRLTMLPSIGILLKPAVTPEPPPQAPVTPPPPEPVTGMRPAEPLGLAPAAPRPVTPFLALATIGKEMHMVVRVNTGLAFMVDAGGPRAITVDAFAQLSTSLGITTVERILVTHPHKDHVRNLLELIETHRIRPENLLVSRSWIDTGASGTEQLIETLRTTTKPELVALGYGPTWTEPGVAVSTTAPITTLRITAGQTQIDVYARGDAHRDYQNQRRDVRQGRRRSMPSETADSASFVYVFGNESSPNRTAVMGDFRGADIAEMHRALGDVQFKEAFRNVRVIKGIGHHFSLTAGRTPTDISGMNLLLEATLVQNGQLTILVQSREGFAFGGTATAAGAEGALLRYFTRQGVRVVFSGAETAAGGGTAVVSSDVQVTTQGTGIQIFDGTDPRVVDMHRRLELLRQARRIVTESPEWGPAALEVHQTYTGPALQQALDQEIQRLEGLARELRGQASVELLQARGEPVSALTGPQRTERSTFEAQNVTAGRTIDQILTEMGQRGPVEGVLSPTALDKLRAAVATGRSPAIEVELAATPRPVLEAIDRLPEARRSSLAKKYREMAELTNTLEADVIPEAQRLQVMLRATELRNELQLAIQEAGGTPPAALEAEVARLTSVVEQVKAQTVSQVETGRDLEGRRTRTEYLRMRGNDLVQRGFHGLGRGMGAVMVIHSVQELGATAQDIATGDATLPESMLRISHSLYGMNIGVRMARTTYSQLTAGTGGKVSGWEFALMAVIEIGAAMTADYKTSEERNAAILGTAIHSTVNLICMYVGQTIMNLSAKFLPHPILKLAGMGLGLAVMFLGEKIIELLGLDDDIARWTQFPPGEVTDVNLKINSLLDDYRIMVGAQQLQQRHPSELTELGVQNPAAVKKAADDTEYDYLVASRSKERELTSLFEAAYDRTRGSYVGLQMLDQQAAEFLRLRGLATGSGKYIDTNREELDRRWRAMDQRLNLSDATAETIKKMEQWEKIDEKLTELDNQLHASTYNVDELLENADKAQLMIENARYRLNPGEVSRYRTNPLRRAEPLRTTPLIPAGTEAYRVYREMLLERETKLAGIHGYLAVRAGDPSPSKIYETNAIDPRSALVRLRTVANGYRELVALVANQLPGLMKPETWATPGELARQVEAANREHPSWFNQIRLAEKSLEIATRQASSSITLADPAPDPVLRQLIEDEMKGAMASMESRRTDFGLIFLTELDVILEERGGKEDMILAAELRAAYPTQKACTGTEPAPFTETEAAALHTDAFKKHGGEVLTSDERQLFEMRRITAPWRSIDMKSNLDPMRDWDKLSRVVDRQYYILPNPYNEWDDDAYFDYVDEYHYDPSLTPIVAVLQWDLKLSDVVYGPFNVVLPINADAVRLLGRRTHKIQTIGGRVIKEADILEQARKNQPPQ